MYDAIGETIFDDRPLPQPMDTSGWSSRSRCPPARPRSLKIRVAKQVGARRTASTLVKRRYAGRGYRVPRQQCDVHLATFLAYDEGKLVGTVGIRLDSERGLRADELYRDKVDVLRSAGYRTCEFTRLAVDSAATSLPVLAGLFHTAYLYAAVVRGFTHAVIEVSPRHVGFYRRSLNFELFGPERVNRRVNAPAVLLFVPFAAIAAGIDKYAGRVEVPGARGSLFVYGFPPLKRQGSSIACAQPSHRTNAGWRIAARCSSSDSKGDR